MIKIIVVWAIFNFIIGLYELYIIINREKLCRDSNDILISGWNLYTKMDPRYCQSVNPVYASEAINAITAVLFLFVGLDIYQNRLNENVKNTAFILSLIQLINVVVYLITLKDVFMAKYWYYIILTLPWLVMPIIVIIWALS
jgi:hypothetical protein